MNDDEDNNKNRENDQMQHAHFRERDFVPHKTGDTKNPPILIAVDGPAASGKGTLSRRLARRLNLAYLDTGLIYRAVGLAVVDAEVNIESEQAIIDLISSHGISKILSEENLENPMLRSDRAAKGASLIGRFPRVRTALLDYQREFAQNPPPSSDGTPYEGSILDGRDIGTVVCPNADLKLFIVANMETRARRRFKELQSKGIEVTYDAVLEDLETRDARDQSRETAPMKAATDAYVLDSSSLTQAEVLERSLDLVRATLVTRTAKLG